MLLPYVGLDLHTEKVHGDILNENVTMIKERKKDN